jgi:isocitrate lyase
MRTGSVARTSGGIQHGTMKHNGHANGFGEQQRWAGITRPYDITAVERLRPSIAIEYTLARQGAERLWSLLQSEPYVASLGAMTGNQAIEQVQAGLKAIYVSGWQVAGDANLAGHMYPDQSLYPSNSVPSLVRAINNAFLRADQICRLDGSGGPHWFAPIVADAEAGFGGVLNAFELMKSLIETGAAAVHFEDQLSSAKNSGHLGGKVVVPIREFVQKRFGTLAGFHSLNAGMFHLAHEYARAGMSAYVRLQEHEFELAEDGYSAVRHQRFVGTGYFDAVQSTIAGGHTSTEALNGSTETAQFTVHRQA